MFSTLENPAFVPPTAPPTPNKAFIVLWLRFFMFLVHAIEITWEVKGNILENPAHSLSV